MHATLVKFGYPDTVIHEGAHWTVVLRPQQATLGALVLACNEPVTAFSRISDEAFAAQAQMVRCVEAMLSRAFGYDRINYLMLMMVDPHVHYHVLPRYAKTPSFQGVEFPDAGWPAVPQLGAGVTPDGELRQALLAHLRANWRAVD
ncbi:MAG: HIT family protein [Pseudomonadales bacterium]